MRSSRRLALVLVVAVVAVVAGGASAFASGSPPPQAQDEDCPGGGYDPVATPVAINSVPVVVESTVDEYFVLYARSDADAQSWEIPVAVVRGEAGTTTLAENVEALPVERYRVEKFLVSDPADVDGDCVDDITELGDPVGRNPVHSAPLISFSDGVASIPDLETFLQTAPFRDSVNTSLTHAVVDSKFILLGRSSERPGLVFINIHTHQIHAEFFYATGLGRGDDFHGNLHYDARMVAPDGSLGAWYLWFQDRLTFTEMDRFYALMAASVSAFDNNVYVYIPAYKLDWFETQRQQYEASRIDVVFDDDLSPDARLEFLNPGVGYGRLRVMDPDGRPHPREVVIYEAVPNELPRVAGIITTVRQAPLSHVNLRAVQDDVPNAYVRDVLDDPDVAALVGGFVRYEVTESGWSLRAATPDEVDEHYESARPSQTQTPPRDLSVTSVTPLSDVHFEDWTAFGVKAANVAELGRLGFTAGTVPEGFAIPFYFYDEFMRANGFHARVDEMLADPDFQADFDVQDGMLDDLRDDIKDADSPQWIIDALTEMHATFPAGTSLRYRSSTNNEDLPGFNGAGLYDSKTQDPDETADDGIDKSLKGVFASLWNFRAFTERDFHRIDHPSAAMGVLVHPNYSDELANGVAVSFDPFYDLGGLSRYYVNTQIGEDLVTNPEAHSVPEALLLIPDGGYVVLSTSNQVVPNELLMSDSQITQLTQHLTTIHDHFEALYRPAAGEPFAIEIEFKITAEDILAIKQARPWIFTVTDVNEAPVVTGTTTFTYRENGTSALHTFRATDPERREITWSVSGPDGGDFAVSETGALSFASPPDYESPADSGADNVYEVTVVARDDAFNSASLSVTVTVTDVNEGPEISGQQSLSFVENQVTDRVLATYSATDPEDPGALITRWSLSSTDAGDFAISESGELTFRSVPDYERPADSGRDNVYNFSVRASDGRYYGYLEVAVTVTDVNEAPVVTGTTTFTYRENGTAAVHTFRATDSERREITWSLSGPDGGDFAVSETGALSFASPPDYESPADSGADNVYEVTVVARDDAFNSASLSVTVTVADVNEGPEISGQPTFTIAENHGLSNASYTGLDPEGGAVTRWTVGGRDGGDFNITQGGTVYFRNLPDYERPADSNRDNVYEVAVRAYDGRVYGSFDVTVTVTDVNESPEIGSPSRDSFTQPENRTSRLYTYSATDPERSTVTWSVAGTDGRLFTIDERGQFSFNESSPPDFDTPADAGGDNIYNVTIQARDPEFNTASLAVTVTVTEVNEGPVITRQGNAAGSVSENHPTTQVLAIYTASDPERPSVRVTGWSVSGTDGGDFVIDAVGELRFRIPPDYERPADANRDNVYELTIRASDGRYTGSLEEVQTVTVTDVNEPPTITTTSRTAFIQQENRDSNLYTFRATDPEGGAVTWTAAGTDGSAFTMDERGALSFSNPPDFENPADAGRDNVYNVTVQARDTAFNTASVNVVVTVGDHNEGVEPTISTRRPPSAFRENATSAVYTFRASDPQRDLIAWSLRGNDAGAFTLTDTGTLMFRSPPDFENPTDSDRDNEYELEVVAADEHSNSDSLTFTVTVTDHNEGVEPTISTRRPPSAFRENATSAVYTFRASDPQRDLIAWSLRGTDAGAFTFTDTGTLMFRSPPDFENPTDSDRDNEYELEVVAVDEHSNSDSLTFTVAVTDVNEGPEIRLEGAATSSVPENHPDSRVLADYAATDPENPNAGIFRWSTSGRDGGDFVISDLGELRFRSSPDYERPADSNRDNIYEVTVRASDGRSYGTLEEPLIVTVTEVNEAPVITTKSRTEFTLRENSTSILYTYRATDQDNDDTITWSVQGTDGEDFAIHNGILTLRLLADFEIPVDADGDNVYEITVVAADQGGLRDIVDAVIIITDQPEGPVIAGRSAFTVTENYDITQELESYTATDAKDSRPVFPQWSVSGRDGGDFVIDRVSGALAFRNTPDYDRPADSDRDNIYEVTIRAHDSRAYANLNVTVAVTNVNESAPAVTGRTSHTVRENTASAIYTYRVTDADLNDTVTWSTGGDDGQLFAMSDRGALSFRAEPDFENPRDTGRDNVYELEVVATDQQGLRGTLEVAVTVTELNEGPVVSGTATFTIDENQDLPNATYTAEDPEATGGVTTNISWRISGRDGGDFAIDSETGVLTFRTPRDYERPADANRDNVYEVTVRAYDGRNYGDFDVVVTVTPVDEPPAVAGRDSLTFRENTPVTTRLYTYRATDPEGDSFTWSLGGDDAGDFEISEQGVLTFAAPPDFDSPRGSGTEPNEYLVTVQARDDQANTGELPVTVTVTDQNEGAVVTGQDAISVEENRDPTITVAAYSAVDPEGEAITRWSLAGSDANDFTINENGDLTFRSTPDYDRPADSNRDNEYHLTVRAYDGRTYGNLDVTISVRNQNEHAPVIRSGSRTSFTYREEATSAVYTYSATDGDKDDVIAWGTAGPDGNLFEFNDRDGLMFTEAPDYENPQDSGADNEYELNVVATDSGALTASLAVTVTVTEVNEGPEITGITTYSIIEGEDLVGATFTARDPEEPAAAVTSWTLARSDAGDFTITETGQNSAQLTFRNTPDYDRPADSNRDNEYLVTVRVSDGHYYGSLDVMVTVTDQNENNPVVSGRDNLSVRENTTSTLYTYSATDMDRGATITWSVRGTDGDDFTISEEGGLSFNSNPNYEHPADSNSDNVYELAVVASDGSNEGTLDVTITITEVNEGPEISGRDTLTVNENHEAVVATYSGTDPEDTSADITRWSVTGRDGGDFTISENGELTFRNPPDFEGPADSNRDNEYEVTVRASDGRVYGTYDISIAVEPVDEAPEFQRSSRTSFTYPENRTSALHTYRATDPEGAVVAWSLSGDDAGDFEIIEDGGVLTFREPPDFDEPADNTEDNEYEVTVVATDQTGHAANMAITVTVTDANEGPELTGRESRTVSENFDDILATYTARDPENPDLEISRWSVTGRDGGDFTINEAGELTFRNPPDFERPADSNRDNEYEVTVRASDGRVYGTLSVTVTVEAVDEAPEFRSGSQDSFAYQENGTSAIYTYRATDPEASDVTWGLSGTDSSAFSISETGALAFNNPPDYESPTDSGRDNVYLVTIEASDDQLNTARLDLTVTVTNVTDLGAPRNLHATDPTSALVGTAS